MPVTTNNGKLNDSHTVTTCHIRWHHNSDNANTNRQLGGHIHCLLKNSQSSGRASWTDTAIVFCRFISLYHYFQRHHWVELGGD